MIKSKKFSVLLLILMLALSSIIFVACGHTDYSKTYLSASQTYIELYKDEEKNLTIKIDNPVDGMSNVIKYSMTNPTVCELSIASQHDMTTTYVVKAKNGGQTTIEFVSLDGAKTVDVTIYVKEYSSVLEANENGLYVSQTSDFTPNSFDFKFSDNSTERDLTYYFYGEKNSTAKLTLNDILDGNNLVNNFVNVHLWTVADSSYLIFTDKDGILHTLGRHKLIAGTGNITYSFMIVKKTESGYTFDFGNATKVNPGDKFTFISIYNRGVEDEEIYCEREFSVIVDINKENVSHEFGYKINEVNYRNNTPGTSYKIESRKKGDITLIPNYVSAIKDNPLLVGYNANYLTAYVEVAIKNFNEFLKLNISTEDKSIASATVLGKVVEGDYTIYCMELNCGTGVESLTNLRINLYYEGFENNADDKVNFIYNIPVNIHIKPSKLLVNNVDLNESSKVYKFYDSYASDIVGWQPLNFTIVPEGAEYDKLYIDLTGSDLQLRYMNVVYTNGIVLITDIDETVYVKGATDAVITESKELSIYLEFSVIQKDSIISKLEYAISAGPSPLKYKTEIFENKIYLERFAGEILFDDIYTDAKFESMKFEHVSGVDVVNFKSDAGNLYTQEGGMFKLNIYLTPKENGNGTYSVILDNGQQITINIEVGESLETLSINTKDENDIIRLIENYNEEGESSSLIYLYYAGNRTYFDLNLIANDSAQSKAIDEILPDISSPNISMTQLENANSFIVYVENTGTLSLTFSVQGYEIAEFQRIIKTIDYKVNIISFDYLQRLNVYKLSDGFGDYAPKTSASYANVYSNTYEEYSRKLTLEVALQNSDAYLFANPSNNKFIDTTYQAEYLYLESDTRIYKDGVAVGIMFFSPSQSNIYTIGSYGTFDTETLTFTAFDNLVNSGNLKLIAHVKQYGKTYSYTINIHIEIYEKVERISLQLATTELEFSTLDREKSLIAYPTNKTATNGKIVAIFKGGEIVDLLSGHTYSILNKDTISYLESDGKTFINLKVSENFLTLAETYENEMVGDLIIVAKDWLDNGGNLRSEYQELALHIKVRFANGTVKNRFTIEDANDLISIKNNLSAHYQISTTIDASNIAAELPLGELKGSIVGVNDYAVITNIKIKNCYEVSGATTELYYGLFTKIAANAYIEYVQFEGDFDVDYKDGASFIGLVAGENNGSLINVGAKISASKVYMQYGNFGGLVGTNNGEIIQDFTLFENLDSSTRTETKTALTNTGRYSYQNKTPLITVQMTDFTTVYYKVENSDDKTQIGGIIGYNTGLLKKIDSNKVKFNGYLNYMGYVYLKSQPINTSGISALPNVFTGGLIGNALVTTTTGKIISGVNIINEHTLLPEFKTYSIYTQNDESTFEAGEGIVVGGEVWAYGSVGGVVGNISGLSSNANEMFAGITTRTFVRGQKIGDATASIAIIANIKNIALSGGLSTTFAIQAVDDGKIAEEGSMAILYNNNDIPAYSTNINLLGFGNHSHSIGVLNGYLGDVSNGPANPINVFTYVSSRQYVEKAEGSDNIIIINTSKDSYYGDFIIVGTEEGEKVVITQKRFTKGNDTNLSISEKFNNKLSTETANAKEVFYAYYFKVASVNENNDLASVQMELDSSLNKINIYSSIYPFIANGEMVFSSKTPDILTIDQVGKITIKKTGLALISASSVLNSNNALNFYIFVVNYFDSESMVAEKSSIIYNDLSASATPIDQSNIELRGNNSAELFVRPKYNLNLEIEENVFFTSDKFGKVSFKGISFNLAENTDVSAKVVDESGLLDITVVGQSINIRKKDSTVEGSYPLTITPILQLKFAGEVGPIVYNIEVNKEITNTKVNYKYGAINIGNKNYITVPVQTSKSVNDEITILSTDEMETNPVYYIVGLDGQALQGDKTGLEYKEADINNYLFNVSFTKNPVVEDAGNGIYKHLYSLNFNVNTLSSIYRDRYNKEIYGTYILYIEPTSNSSLSISIKIEFERTEITSVIIDNYKSLNEMEGTSLSSTSEFAYPGENGLLQITVSPEDSDFDYVIIENDAMNYENGHATATFSLLSRNETAVGTGLFADEVKIVGSATSKGIKLTQAEIIAAYAETGIVNYNGIIYIKYSMSSKNVIDLSESKINITFYKDGNKIFPAFKNLKVKLKHFVGIEIVGKEGDDQGSYYKSYNVARGLRYKLNINSFGFKQENIEVKSTNSNIGKVTQENGSYYLTITSGAIDYSGNSNVFNLVVEAKQNEGENIRQAESQTKITVFEYVLNYNNDLHNDADIITGAGNGIINVQVGSQIDLEIDLFEFVEYDSSIVSVVNSIKKLFADLAEEGNWYAFTNLISDDQPDYNKAPEYDLADVDLGAATRQIYVIDEHKTIKNYFFKSEGLKVMPIRTHIPEENFYYFGYFGSFKEENGIYVYDDSGVVTANIIKTKFVLNVYTTSSEESPIPVYDYEDLRNMQKGGYYILLNDITLPNATDESLGVTTFAPLKGNFASFDGNGHSINFAGTYDMGNASEIGLFKSLEDGSIIKNLIVNFTSSNSESDLNTNPNDTTYGLYNLRTVKFVTTSDTFIFGSIVAENSGIITNCQVYTENTESSEYYLAVKADNALTGSSYIGGLVGRNNGYITNCGVSMNIKSPFNIGGVVAQNYNKIAGCYFSKGKLINNSQFSQYVGGFALSNSNNGQIMTSYVAGKQTSSSIYSQDSESFITSTIIGAGFIVENIGNINDCYTDINLSRTTSEMAGFVYRNGGNVKNSFSLSILRNNTTASAGFVKEGKVNEFTGTYVNCYYLIDEGVNKINTSLSDKSFDGVQALNEEQFYNFEEYFSDYSYGENLSTYSVWFVAKGNTSSTFVEYIPTTQKVVIEGEDGNAQSNTVYKTEIMQFGKNRLELVSPNVRVLSVRNFAYSDMDESTGIVTYFYNDDSSTPNRGTIHNPRLIYSAESMENEILNQTSSTNLNSTNYRMIRDVSYNEFEGHSSLYKVKFAGIFEGNGMKISGISLISMDELSSAGMFAQIGYSSSKQGSVKNLVISAKNVSFNNTDAVGILAGTVKYGYVFDVTTDSVQGNSKTVTGLKFVGGVFGKAINSFVIKDVYSSANVSANYSPDLDTSYTESGTESGEFSYAGSIAGFVGKGKLYNAHVIDVTSVMGGRAGFAYGGIGAGSDVRYTFVDVVPSSTIKAYQYGGYVAGEINGNLTYAHVSNNEETEFTFSNIPKVAYAVGGIAGRFNGGVISNALMEQDFSISTTESNLTIASVGGLVGLVSANDSAIAKFEDCIVNADISAGSLLGGGIGKITSATQINGIAIKSDKLSISGQRANPCLGGVVGLITDKGSLDMSNSYCNSLIEIKTYTAGVQSVAFAGGLIGETRVLPHLYYCYTSSRIDAQVYDSRQISDLKDFASAKNEDYKDYIAYEQRLYGNDESVNEAYKEAYSEVYYWGISDNGEEKGTTVADDEIIYEAGSSFVSFKTKAKLVSIKLCVSNFGVSTEGGYSASSLNNVFGQNYQLENQETGASEVINLKKTNLGYEDDSYIYEFSEAEQGYFYTEAFSPAGLESLKENNARGRKIYYIAGGNKYEFSKVIKNIDEVDIVEYSLKLYGTNSTYIWNGTDAFEYGSRKIYLTSPVSPSSDEIYINQISYGFKEIDLLQEAVFKGVDGNYYVKYLDEATVTEKVKNIKTGEIVDIELYDDPVWNSEINALSTLSMENQFNWLNKV